MKRRNKFARIKALVGLVLIATLSFNIAAQTGRNATKREAVLRRGQVLELSLITPLDSAQSHVGDLIELKLVRPLTVAGAEVLPADSVIHGRNTNVSRAGKNCKEGNVRWNLLAVNIGSGRTVEIQPIPAYLAKRGTTVVERVHLATAGEKVTRGVGHIGEGLALAPVVILFSPLLIPMAIVMSGEGGCDGSIGAEEFLPAGTNFYAAVSHDIRFH